MKTITWRVDSLENGKSFKGFESESELDRLNNLEKCRELHPKHKFWIVRIDRDTTTTETVIEESK